MQMSNTMVNGQATGSRLALLIKCTMIVVMLCFIVAWYAFTFVMIEYQDGMTAFESVPVWVTEIIIPYAFFTMAIRYLLSAFLPHTMQSD